MPEFEIRKFYFKKRRYLKVNYARINGRNICKFDSITIDSEIFGFDENIFNHLNFMKSIKTRQLIRYLNSKTNFEDLKKYVTGKIDVKLEDLEELNYNKFINEFPKNIIPKFCDLDENEKYIDLELILNIMLESNKFIDIFNDEVAERILNKLNSSKYSKDTELEERILKEVNNIESRIFSSDTQISTNDN